jgi:hypothetical protein
MFEANKKLDDDEEDGGKPAFGVVVSMGEKRSAFNPSAKLDDDVGDGEMGAEGRYKEAVAIMAKMFNAGRVDEEKLGQCLREAFKALEEEPHKEYEHEEEEA